MDGIEIAGVQRIADVQHMTLNGWLARKLIPNIPPTEQGKARLFDLQATLHIATTALLVSLGFDVGFAALCASEAANAYDRRGSRLVIGPRRRTGRGPTGSRTVDVIDAPEPGDLDDKLDGFIDGRPEAFCVVELDRLGERVRRAFKEEAEQRARGFTSGFRRVERRWETE